MATRPSTGPQHVPSWALRANEAIDAVLTLLVVSLLWWALTLLGLVVLGAAPAACAAAEVMRARAEGRAVPVARTMWATYRRELVPATLRLLPFGVIVLGGLSTLFLALRGGVPEPWMLAPVATLGAVAAGWATASAAALIAVPRLRRQDLLVSWRVALLCPGAVPVAAFLLVLTLAVIGLVALVLPPIGLLLGPGGAAQAASALMGRRTEALLARHGSPS